MPNKSENNKISKEFRVILMGYPDNPIGTVFFKVFQRKNVPLKGVIVENKHAKSNWKRFTKKVQKDGFLMAFNRIVQVIMLKIFRKNLVQLCDKYSIPCYRVEKFNSIACAKLLKNLKVDIIAIASTPILKEMIFSKARVGCLNAHPGWLPKYRGIGANSYAIKNGDLPGVSVHYIDCGIDTGKIIIRERIHIKPNDRVSKINDRAVVRGAELMSEVIHQIRENRLKMPIIDESIGKLYMAMPYKKVKEVNKMLKELRKKQTVMKLDEQINSC